MIAHSLIEQAEPPETLDLADMIARLRAKWMDDGLCQDYPRDLWFPERGERTSPAKTICAQCPVSTQCLDHALVNGEYHGIWGGKSEKERRYIRIGRVA